MNDTSKALLDWLKQILTLESAAVALVAAFIDPTKAAEARPLAALALLSLAVSILAGCAISFVEIVYHDVVLEGPRAVISLGTFVIHVAGFGIGFALLAAFGWVNLT